MKETYISPWAQLLCLSADSYLANDEVEFDDMLSGSGGGVSANPDLDIDIPLS